MLQVFYRVIKIVIITFGIYYLLVFGYSSFNRFIYPYELEWMEGGMAETIHRINDGNNIYVPPTPEFIPYIYTPLFYYSSAGLTLLSGLEPIYSMRLFSIISTIFSLFLIFKICRKYGADAFFSFSAVGIFAALYPIALGWYDIARNDMMMTCLLLLSFYLLSFKKRNYVIASGIVAALAFFTKQSSAAIIAGLAIALIFIDRKLFWQFSIVTGILVLAGVVVFEITTDGWFSFYVFEVPSNHNWRFRHAASFYFHGLAKPMFISVILFAIGLIAIYKRKIGYELIPLVVLTFGTGISATLLLLHEGGWFNALFPLHCSIAIFCAVWVSNYKRGRVGKINIILSFLLLGQMAVLAYNPFRLIPDERDSIAGESLVEYIKNVEGNVWLPSHTLIARLAGKKTMAHQMAVIDILKTKTPQAELLRRQFDSLLSQKVFPMIIDNQFPKLENIEKFYYKSGSFFNNDEFLCRTGLRTRPEFIYKPR